MTASAWLHKRRALFLVILFFAFSAFTADILDLREECYTLSGPYETLDSDISAAATGDHRFDQREAPSVRFVRQHGTENLSFFHLLPYSFRAPPAFS